MSVHSLSNLAVQELSDESAAIHGGGVGFQGFDGLNGTGVSSPLLNFSNTTPIGRIASIAFAGSLARANNKLESFRSGGVQAGRNYKVSFFDDTNFTTFLGAFNFNSSNSGATLNLAPTLRNRTGSVRIERTA